MFFRKHHMCWHWQLIKTPAYPIECILDEFFWQAGAICYRPLEGCCEK